MKFPKLDYTKIAMQTAGEAGGLLSLNLLGKVKFVANAKPGMKGVIYKAAGVLAKAFFAKGKKGTDIVDGAANALSVAGTSQLLAAFMPGKVPVIGGYEDYPINGAGVEMEGVDDDDPNGVEGYEDNIMQ